MRIIVVLLLVMSSAVQAQLLCSDFSNAKQVQPGTLVLEFTAPQGDCLQFFCNGVSSETCIPRQQWFPRPTPGVNALPVQPCELQTGVLTTAEVCCASAACVGTPTTTPTIPPIPTQTPTNSPVPPTSTPQPRPTPPVIL